MSPNPYFFNYFRLLLIALLVLPLSALQPQTHNWASHAEVAKKTREKFNNVKTFSSEFRLTTVDGKTTRQMKGILHYGQGGKIRFDFHSPSGDFIVSDGKIMWIYIHRLGAAGKQDLSMDVKDENDGGIFLASPGPGLDRLFSKYHYRFDSMEQPREVDGKRAFVLDLTQRVKIGGFEAIKLFINPESFLIEKAIGTDSLGKRTTIEFFNQKIDPPLEGKIFQYSPGENVRVVNNPLVSE
jgi:outer membrane lipoprotein-sorting protein